MSCSALGRRLVACLLKISEAQRRDLVETVALNRRVNLVLFVFVGASPYIMNCNMTIDTQDLALGRIVASAICESTPGGIPGVQVMALPHEGAVEIACNVESVQGGPPSSSSYGEEQCSSFTIGWHNFCHAPASLITAQVAVLARHHGVAIKGTALVGFTPDECQRLAEGALSNGIGELWKELQCVHM
uniref:Zgc:153901 n=1 Tax=Sinocyclocheilus rhinocerous TaxID=307959 RepID=A0A673LZC4_9TELE